jgi:hypothetical protein
MKFDKLYLLKLSPDSVIHSSTKSYEEWNQVPVSRKWCNIDSAGWNRLLPDSLSSQTADGSVKESPTIRDKIMVIAHGDPAHVGETDKKDQTMIKYTAAKLAQKLKEWGLREAGLITFKCCEVGQANFLENFIAEATKRGLKIGWVKGYTGSAMTLRKPKMKAVGWQPVFGKPTEYINTERKILGFKIGLPVKGSRYKIVKGNAAYDIPNSRYLLDNDDDN